MLYETRKDVLLYYYIIMVKIHIGYSIMNVDFELYRVSISKKIP